MAELGRLAILFARLQSGYDPHQPLQEFAITMLHTSPAEISQTDYDRLLEEPGVEYANGRVIERTASMATAATVGAMLYRATADHKVHVFSSSLGYRCYAGDLRKVRKPHVSAIRGERLVGVDWQAATSPVPAELVVEIVLPGQTFCNAMERVEEYLANGFPLIWIVEPRTRTVTIYRPDSVTRLHGDDEINGESALPSFRCKISEFFPKLLPKA